MSQPSDVSRRGFLLGAAASALAAQLPPAASLPEVAMDWVSTQDMTATTWYISAVEMDSQRMFVEVAAFDAKENLRSVRSSILDPNAVHAGSLRLAEAALLRQSGRLHPEAAPARRSALEVINRVTYESVTKAFELWSTNHGYELGDIVRLSDGLYEK